METTSAVSDKQNQRRVVSLTIGAAILCICVMSFSSNPMTMYALVFSQDLKLNPAQVAFIFSATPIAGFVCSLIAGPLFKKVNFNFIVSLAIIFCAGGLVCWSFSTGYTTVIIGALLQGVGIKLGGFLPTQMMLMNWYKKGAGKIVGMVGAMDNLVSSVYIIGVTAMMVSIGWRMTALVQAVCILIPGLVAAIFMVRYSPFPLGMKPVGATDQDIEVAQKAAAGEKVEIPGMSFQQILRSPVFYATITVLVLQTFIMMFFISNQTLILSANGMSEMHISIAISAFSITNVVNKILFGVVVDKKGIRVAALYCYIGVFAGIFALLNAYTLPLGILYSVLYGLIGGPLTMIGIFTAEKVFGKKDIQITTSIFQAATGLGGILGPIVVAAMFSINNNYMIPAVFCAAAVLVCILLVLIFIRPKNYFKEDVVAESGKVAGH